MLHGKKILIGVCGSIAAYKIAILIRLLIKQGAEVKIIMTNSALDFITPLTLSTLSRNPVLTQFQEEKTGEWNSHIDLGLWADLFLIAPASAKTISKMANGICDNLLLATYLSARCPVFVAPAMDVDMYQHASTKGNLEKLSSYGNHLVEAPYGELASGLSGEGRMTEPEDLLEILKEHFKKKDEFRGLSVLITAGPTHEKIDPVRFISNFSSGKMGYALADELAKRGATVNLVSGPTHLRLKQAKINRIQVSSAQDMYKVCLAFYEKTDIAIFSAAVADYRPSIPAEQKIKKSAGPLSIELVKNPDIAFELGQKKKNKQVNVGFALETDNEIRNATLKLKEKNLDFIVLNSMQDKGAGFSSETNKISILDETGLKKSFELKHKTLVAKDIVDFLSNRIHDS
ncbi:MAG: bifunctional phosphopantothenoylcysteine decarboxylase/phosphopantothenate--cysteine ligase CoaBC [Cyclobacteriaceae bacterium]|nr:bifunctional phosphopantothenoylcysteine decarboxylase/phosphopantothenate--cysteine ligase CoaBC [Cyclobacteriaceae bacterium]